MNEGKKAFKGIVVIFKPAVTDAGVFKVQEPLKQVICLCGGRVDVKNAKNLFTRIGLRTEEKVGMAERLVAMFREVHDCD